MRPGSYYRAQIFKSFNIMARGGNVLDVGSYDGYWLSTQVAKQKYALDIDIVKKYSGIHYVQHTALDIPFKDGTFDQVFAFDVLEHIEIGKEEQFFNELIRVCKKNGEIILSIPSKAIKLFPGFLTNYISRKWGHSKCNGYSENELIMFLSERENIRYEIIPNNAPYFRTFYIFWGIA